MSIQKRTGKRGTTYVVRWRDPKPREQTFARRIDAEKFERAIRHNRDAGTYRDPALAKVTFQEWHDRWWPTIQAGREPNTLAQYECILRLHVLPTFGPRRLSELRRIDVEEWLGALAEKGLGQSGVRTARTVAGMVLRSAVESGVIFSSPLAGIRLPRPHAKAKQALTAAQVEKLVAVVESPYRALVLVLAYAGLRPGEALALRRRHLTDLGQLVVEEGQTEVRGRLRIAGTKTHQLRVVPLPASVLEALRDHMELGEGDAEAPIFTTPTGARVRLSNFRGIFDRARRDAGLPEWVTPYTLRHTAASLLAQRGVPPSTAAAMLGHDPAVFLRTYAHLYPDDLNAAARALEGARQEATQPALPVAGIHVPAGS